MNIKSPLKVIAIVSFAGLMTACASTQDIENLQAQIDLLNRKVDQVALTANAADNKASRALARTEAAMVTSKVVNYDRSWRAK